jgi:acetyl esterase
VRDKITRDILEKVTKMTKFRKAILMVAFSTALSGPAIAAPILEPTTQRFIDSLRGSTPIYRLSPAAARAVLDKVQSGAVEMPQASVQQIDLPVGPTGQTSVHVVRPDGATGPLPVIVYFHGGGWILGNFHTHERLVRQLAAGTGAVVVFVDYTASPEAKYPVAINQSYAVTKYVADHAAELDVDASRLAIAGDSVGGNMAAVVSLLAKEHNSPKIAAQVLFYPVTDATLNDNSYKTFANGPWLTQAAMKWFWDSYQPDVGARRDPHISPLNATTEQLRGLPPALVITDANDVLRDQGEAYAEKLMKADVTVTTTRYLGTTHDFVMLNAEADTPAARGAIAQAVNFLKSTFAQ